MKKQKSTILIVLVFLVGLTVMLYPTVSNFYNEKVNSYVVSNYNNEIDDKNIEDLKKLLTEAKEYNKQLHTLPKNFVSDEPKSDDYKNTLNVSDGVMGYIVIDCIDIKIPISHGTAESVLQKKIGHLEGSSLPTGEIGNNTVLTGHTGLPSAKLFTDLDKVKTGDTFEICVLNETFTYKVFNIVVVEPQELDDLEAISGKDIVTLVTCTPYGVNSHRLLVQGEQIKMPEKEDIVLETNSNLEEITLMEFVPAVLFLIVVLLLILIIISHKKDKKYRHKEK